MKLHDVIPLQKPKRWTKQLLETEAVVHAQNLAEDYEGFSSFEEYAENRDEKKVFGEIKNRMRSAFESCREELLLEHHSLPETLLNEEGKDLLTRAAKAHRVPLKEVRDIADDLGFVVIPFDYLDERSFKDESYELQRAIRSFDKQLQKLYDIYVIAPIHHYNIQNHVNSEHDLPIYAGKPCQQAFMAINMAVPMFRTLADRIAQVEEHSGKVAAQVNRNSQRLDAHAQELKNLARRIDELKVQVERQRAEALIAQAKQKQLQEQLATLQREQRFWAYEPMMLAVPKDAGINGDAPAIVGPCWGPDFEDIVAAALKLKNIEGQGEMLSQAALEWVERGASVRRTGGWHPITPLPQIRQSFTDSRFDDDERFAYGGYRD